MRCLSAALFVLGCVLVERAAGHGAMQFPETRNVFKSHYCPQCANGSGVCGAGGSTQWPADSSASAKLNSEYTTSLTELVAGGMVEVEVYLTAVHQGHFALELCANPGSTISEDCFVRLERDPTDTRFSAFASSAPWAAIFPENGCASSFTTSSPMKVRFVLPAGVSSDHAVLRWYWQSGNSCDSMSETSKDAPSEVKQWSANINGKSCKAAISQSGRLCGDQCPNASCTNEQFKNCADVKIVTGDSNVIVTSSGKQPGNGSNAGNGETGNDGNDNNGNDNNGNDNNGNDNNNNNGNDNDNDHDNNSGNDNDHDNNNGSNHGNDNDNDNKTQEHHEDGDEGNQGTGVDWTGDVAKCKKSVEGRHSGWDDLCESLCEQVAQPNAPQQQWCLDKGYTQLYKCVYKFYSTICEDD
eukprot:Gregarina_sp_Pseudo_9__824@NODE_1527_length_1523_cov_268_074798_g1415_i0_p1_GENE_NODE_1527_length_1523_cov_268_074798_g1415_i0NODE_1527_length_1523_cov_268_074798_g1415_i0_p1_ORF_typecomplete_len412_score108_05LPMO_10/PF03067_15/6_8e20LPMO_10/PF03067_15/1_1e04DUF4643/PF15485_6/0_15SDA1/PF05285_12/7_7_NODE_1527_length_1523_cov_268_074798_g1415_i01121347